MEAERIHFKHTQTALNVKKSLSARMKMIPDRNLDLNEGMKKQK